MCYLDFLFKMVYNIQECNLKFFPQKGDEMRQFFVYIFSFLGLIVAASEPTIEAPVWKVLIQIGLALLCWGLAWLVHRRADQKTWNYLWGRVWHHNPPSLLRKSKLLL